MWNVIANGSLHVQAAARTTQVIRSSHACARMHRHNKCGETCLLPLNKQIRILELNTTHHSHCTLANWMTICERKKEKRRQQPRIENHLTFKCVYSVYPHRSRSSGNPLAPPTIGRATDNVRTTEIHWTRNRMNRYAVMRIMWSHTNPHTHTEKAEVSRCSAHCNQRRTWNRISAERAYYFRN